MKIKVNYYTPNKGAQGSTVGFVGVVITDPPIDLYISKLFVIRAKSGHLFVAGPSEKYTDHHGEEKYRKYFWFGKEMSEEFERAVIEGINEYIDLKMPGEKHLSSSTNDEPKMKSFQEAGLEGCLNNSELTSQNYKDHK